MIKPAELRTKRLILRQWKLEDYSHFARINADPEVMNFYSRTLSENESKQMADKLKYLISLRGWGLWAVETITDKAFIGFVGLHEPRDDLPVAPCVEIGWRLDKNYWGHGYATEAAQACLKCAFDVIDLAEVYSFASLLNIKSYAVMQRLNMLDTGNNFEHPGFAQGHESAEHVLYKITKEQWLSDAV